MARYFRCEEPTLRCPHARTHAVQVEQAGVCPIDNPDCERCRRPVPLWTALWQRHPQRSLAAAGLLGLIMVVLFLSGVFGGGGWRADLAGFQAELDALAIRLNKLDTPSAPRTLDSLALKRLDEQTQRMKQSVEQAVVTNAAKEDVSRLAAEGESIEHQLAQWRGAEGPDPESVARQVEAQQLARDYEGLEDRVETDRTLAVPGDEASEQGFSDLIEQIRPDMRRARQLAAPVPIPAPSPGDAALIDRIQTTLAANRAALEQLASKPRPPFPSAEAGLSIATSQTLAESLVLPLLEGHFGGAVTAEPSARRWFIASKDSTIAPGVVVTVAADDPYGPLVDGTADLVLTDQAADAAVRARFAQAFGGKELDSRAFSEVVALDAVALLGNPGAPATPVDLASLAHGPWLVRSDDAERIRRLTAGAVTMKEVPNPFQPLLAAASSRALVLYHQCKPNLAARFLPFQPAADARALAPSPFSIATEDYRLAFRIIAAHGPGARPAARDFMNYLTSDPGQDRIAATGFVDLRLRHRQETVDPTILIALAKALGLQSIARASRYSTNLRFGVNESELDIKAQADLQRLPHSLAQEFPNDKVVVLGFTDDTGGAAINVPLSIKRAQTIAAMLKQFGIGAAAAGLGQQFSVDTNGTDEGRARNRRAEIWVVQ